jgi:hypothetical protein
MHRRAKMYSAIRSKVARPRGQAFPTIHSFVLNVSFSTEVRRLRRRCQLPLKCPFLIYYSVN